jgi:hypothetical protein
MSIAMVELSPIASRDISDQIEAGLPENGNKSANPMLGVALSKGPKKSRFVTLTCAIVAAVVGVGIVLGLSLDSTGNDSKRQSAAVNVDQPSTSSSSVSKRMDESQSFNSNGSTSTEAVNNFLCEIAGQIPADTRNNFGKYRATTAGQEHALGDHLPVCFDEALSFKSEFSSWYWFRSQIGGEVSAEFDEISKTKRYDAFDLHVSVYEGECGEALGLTCMRTQGIEHGSSGSVTWIAVKDKVYKLRVQHMPGAEFGMSITSTDN